MAHKATTIKDAIKQWEGENDGQIAGDAEKVMLNGVMPPIEKMDASLGALKSVKRLALSTNAIEKITGLNGLTNLEILSLGRNGLRKIDGLEPVGGTLKQLWLSYNYIDKLGGLTVCPNLEVLYISNNRVSSWGEIEKLGDNKNLREVLFKANPIEEKYSKEGTWRVEFVKRVKQIKKLDGYIIEDSEREAAGVA